MRKISVKIKVSYEKKEELERVKRSLETLRFTWKYSGKEGDRYRRAYGILKEENNGAAGQG